jgi:hypothetical protein
MKLKIIKPKIDKATLYRFAFNEACNILVRAGFYKSTRSAEFSILTRIKKHGNI